MLIDHGKLNVVAVTPVILDDEQNKDQDTSTADVFSSNTEQQGEDQESDVNAKENKHEKQVEPDKLQKAIVQMQLEALLEG